MLEVALWPETTERLDPLQAADWYRALVRGAPPSRSGDVAPLVMEIRGMPLALEVRGMPDPARASLTGTSIRFSVPAPQFLWADVPWLSVHEVMPRIQDAATRHRCVLFLPDLQIVTHPGDDPRDWGELAEAQLMAADRFFALWHDDRRHDATAEHEGAPTGLMETPGQLEQTLRIGLWRNGPPGTDVAVLFEQLAQGAGRIPNDRTTEVWWKDLRSAIGSDDRTQLARRDGFVLIHTPLVMADEVGMAVQHVAFTHGLNMFDPDRGLLLAETRPLQD